MLKQHELKFKSASSNPHELRVQLYELRIQVYKLQVQIHELQVQTHELRVQIHKASNKWKLK